MKCPGPLVPWSRSRCPLVSWSLGPQGPIITDISTTKRGNPAQLCAPCLHSTCPQITKIISGSRSVSVRSCRIEHSKIAKSSYDEPVPLKLMRATAGSNSLDESKTDSNGAVGHQLIVSQLKVICTRLSQHHHTPQLQAGLSTFEQF